MKSMKKTISVLVAMSMVVGLTPAPKADAAKKILLSSKSITLKVKKTKTLKLKQGSKAITKGVKWSSSDSKVAAVTSKGKVTAKKAGKATITAKYKKKSYKCKVTVKAASTSSKTSQTEAPATTALATATAAVSPSASTSTAAVNTQAPGSTNAPLSTTDAAASSTPTVTQSAGASSIPTVTQSAGAFSTPAATRNPAAPQKTEEATAPVETEKAAPQKTAEATAPVETEKAAPQETEDVAPIETEAAPQETEDAAPVETEAAPQETEDAAPVETEAAPQETTEVSDPEASEEPSEGNFFKDNVTIDYDTISKYVEFDVKTSGGQLDPAEVEALTELGFTIDEDKGIAYKDQLCESVKYTFKKLPTTLEDIESFFDEPEAEIESEEYGCTLNYGGFNAMAANICAACTFKGGSNPADPFFEKDPVREMFEYINGPATQMNIAKSQMDNAITSMKAAIQSCGENVYKSYFNGATPQNNYEPDEPYVLEMYKGPYYIEQKETITGTRPTTYMILVKSGGEDSERYIDVYYSTKMSRWFSYENQFMHVTANNFKTPEEEL